MCLNRLRFQDLPDDVLLEILCHIRVEALLRLRQTCKGIESLSKSKQVWLNILHFEFDMQRHVWPSYLKPADELCAEGFEPLAAHLVRLNRRKHSQGNRSSWASLHRARSVTWVQLLYGRWLAVAEADQSSSVLSIWELSSLFLAEGSQIIPVYQAFLEGPVVDGILDSQLGTSILALELRPALRNVVEIIEIRQSEGHITCVRLSHLDGVSRVRDLYGPILAFAVHDGLSVPTVMNWRTGAIHHLLSGPDDGGGAVAMKVEKNVVAVLSPLKLRIFSLDSHDCHAIKSELVRTIPMRHSIGFATLQFYQSSFHPGSVAIYMALSGDNGAFVYSAELHTLLSQARPEADPLTCVWRHDAPLDGLPTPERQHDEPFKLLFGRHAPTLSWLSGAMAYNSRISFKTLSDRLPDRLTDGPYKADEIPYETSYLGTQPHAFELNDPSMPALYARGLYDYDDTLGLVVFGNTFGELCVFNLAGSVIEKLHDCFEPLVLPTVTPTCDALPTGEVTFSSALEFLFTAPPDLTERQKEDVISRWRVLQPQDLPPGWHREATDPAIIGTPRFPFADYDTWLDYIPTLRCGETDIAWNLEYALHFYGDPVPLARDGFAHVFESGGLLFVWEPEGQQLFVAAYGTTLDQVMSTFNGGQGAPLSLRETDMMAEAVGRGYYNTWDWERSTFGRNRWKELEQRGGVVDPVYT